MAKAPCWPRQTPWGTYLTHLGKGDPANPEFPPISQTHNQEITRIHQGSTSYIHSQNHIYEESSGNFWLFVRNWFALTFRHTFFKSSYLIFAFVQRSCHFYWSISYMAELSLLWNGHIHWTVTSTELSLLLNCRFYWIFASTELSLLVNCHTYWIVIPTLNSSSACSLTTNMQVLKAHSNQIEGFR